VRKQLFVVVLLLLSNAFAQNSKRGCRSYGDPTVASELVKLQKWVNEGHQPWRMDAALVANAEAEKRYKSVLTSVRLRETERDAEFEFKDADGKGYHRIALRRLKAVRKYSDNWTNTIWTVLSITDCRST
jgi:hypothetical protein